MNSRLSYVPIGRRRRLAATLGLFTLLLLAVGVLAATGNDSPAAPVFSAIAIAVALFLALVVWGLHRSVTLDLAAQRLEQAIEDVVAEHGGHAQMCGCGHEHDPNELHVTDAETCAHDGSGQACEHNCETCVLAAMRPSQAQARSQQHAG